LIKEKAPGTESINIFTDESAKDGKSVAGIWNHKEINLNFSFRTLAKQDAYHEELQGVIYGVVNAILEVTNTLFIDNTAVVSLEEKITSNQKIIWKKHPNSTIGRLLQSVINIRNNENKTEIKFKKIKRHSGIEGNEEVDKKAKEGLDKEYTYLSQEDLTPFENKISLIHSNIEIPSNYRKELKKIHLKEYTNKAKKDRNIQ
jgi:ribonuclease HI